jgi:crotonobetainyl-CoA:carnitine CoA-transferase CaiB-like acyl-CoA transferase
MKPLAGHRVAALGETAQRPLARYLASLGADITDSVAGASFILDDDLSDATANGPLPDDIIHVSVTTFGRGGPRAAWKGGEFVASAMGGALRVTGEPDRPPVKEALDACTFHADMAAAAGAMAAHFARGSHGRGQHVDVSIQQVAFSRNVNGILVWQFDRRKLGRAGGCIAYGNARIRVIWRLADGWCFHSLMTGRLGAPANQALSDWMDEAGLPNPLREIDWLQYNRSTLPQDTRAVWETAIAAFFAIRTKAEIATEGLLRGINACVVNEPADVLADPHLAARQFLDTSSRLPERFVTFREGPPATAPAVHTGDRPGPLSGVRVLDFAWALVGSITTKTLGDLGAEIVKIESRSRPDLARLDVQVSASRPGNFDDKPWFAHLNSSKRSLTLDMKRPEARAVLEPLIDWADVVVENFSPGTMAKLGLDYDALVQRNPAIVMVSGSVYGQTGPLAQQWGVDGTGGALSGRTFLTGEHDRDPVIPGAVPYGDVIVPFAMVASVAAALQHRRTTGRGCHIDASMYEICVEQMRDALRDARDGGRPGRTGNADPRLHWQGLLRCAGDDRWVAVSLPTEEDEERLRAATGGEPADWAASRDDRTVMDTLQRLGIPCGALQDCEDMIEGDPQLAGRQALVELDHPLLGRFGHVNTPIAFSRDAFRPFRAPSMGEHRVEILRDICGFDPQRIAALEEAGVLT